MVLRGGVNGALMGKKRNERSTDRLLLLNSHIDIGRTSAFRYQCHYEYTPRSFADALFSFKPTIYKLPLVLRSQLYIYHHHLPQPPNPIPTNLHQSVYTTNTGTTPPLSVPTNLLRLALSFIQTQYPPPIPTPNFHFHQFQYKSSCFSSSIPISFIFFLAHLSDSIRAEIEKREYRTSRVANNAFLDLLVSISIASAWACSSACRFICEQSSPLHFCNNSLISAGCLFGCELSSSMFFFTRSTDSFSSPQVFCI